MKPLELTNLETADLCRQLALLMHAGVAAGDALNLLAEEEQNAEMRELLVSMTQDMDTGIFLSQAFENAGCFPVYITGLLQVGEQVGRIEETLTALANYYDEKERMERSLVSSLTYPAILLMLMAVVIVILLSQVLPVFNDIYASLGGKLTGMAGGLLLLGQALDGAIPYLCGLLFVVLGAVAVFSLNRKLRKKAIGLFAAKWGDRGIMRKMNQARFAQALSMGVTSGMPLEEATDLAAALLRDIPPLAQRCGECSRMLQEGENLAESLEKTDLMPAALCRLLTLGLRSGTGDSVMEEISTRMQNDAQQELESMVAKVEPALVLVTSVLVGAILLSVMLPLMNIMTTIG